MWEGTPFICHIGPFLLKSERGGLLKTHLVKWGAAVLSPVLGLQHDQLGILYLIGRVLVGTLLIGAGLAWRLHTWWDSWRGFTLFAQLELIRAQWERLARKAVRFVNQRSTGGWNRC